MGVRQAPPLGKGGRPRADDRSTLDAILYVLKICTPWNSFPQYGDDVTAWRRLKLWEEKGVWKGIMDRPVSEGCAMGAVDMDTLSMDSDTIPAKKGDSSSTSTTTRG